MENELIRQEIDRVLHLNAIDRTTLGVSSTKEEKDYVKMVERQRLLSVRHLDREKIDRLLETDND